MNQGTFCTLFADYIIQMNNSRYAKKIPFAYIPFMCNFVEETRVLRIIVIVLLHHSLLLVKLNLILYLIRNQFVLSLISRKKLVFVQNWKMAIVAEINPVLFSNTFVIFNLPMVNFVGNTIPNLNILLKFIFSS